MTSGYVVSSFGPFGCVSVFDPPSTITTGTTYLGASYSIRTVVSGFQGSVAYANSLQIRFRAGDFATDNSATTSTSGLLRSTRSKILQNTKSGLLKGTNTSNKAKKNGLEGGAIAGVVIGALCGLILLLAGVFLLFRRRHSKARKKPGSGHSDKHERVELDGQPVVQAAQDPAELDGRGVFAATHDSEVADEGAQGNFIELEGRSIPRQLLVRESAPASGLPDSPMEMDIEKPAGHFSSDGGTAGAGNPSLEEAELQRRLDRVREERERLLKMNELNRAEAELEAKLAATRAVGGTTRQQVG
jgi:hypothetical protein